MLLKDLAELLCRPGVRHIDNYDFSEVIKVAQASKGFEKDEPVKSITVGFGKNTVLSVAPAVLDGVQKGDIKHFFFIGEFLLCSSSI